MLLAVIIPCFNEQDVLPEFYRQITSVIKPLTDQYQLIFIDDGSTDETLTILRNFSKNDVHVKYISFSRNFGKEAAMYAGFCNSEANYVAVMDCDLQDPPYLLAEMLKLIESDKYDCIAARRINRKGEPFIRSLFAKSFYKIINKISDINIVEGARDFRLMRYGMVKAIISVSEYNRFSKGIFTWVGFRTFWLPYENIGRISGKSKWSFWHLLRYAINGIMDYSQVPLYIASWFGIAMTFLSFLAFIFIVFRRLIFGDPVGGWASLICTIIFIGGVQLFCIGIVGQYIAKTYMETKRRPHYIIAKSNIPINKKNTFHDNLSLKSE